MKENQRKAMSSELQTTGYAVSKKKRQTHPAEKLPAEQWKMNISCDKTMKLC